MELEPAQVQAVATFYDMYNLEPVGRHLVEVCTNLSCALVGAKQVVDVPRKLESGWARPPTTARSPEADRVCGRLRLCPGGRGRQPVPGAHPPEDVPRSSRSSEVAELTVLKGADERDLTRLDEYQAIGGYGRWRRRGG